LRNSPPAGGLAALPAPLGWPDSAESETEAADRSRDRPGFDPEGDSHELGIVNAASSPGPQKHRLCDGAPGRLLFIAKPGEEEDLQGLLSWRGRQVLKTFEQTGLRREEVYITTWSNAAPGNEPERMRPAMPPFLAEAD